MKRVAALYGGSFPEQAVLSRPNCQRWLTDTIYLPDLPETDLSVFDGILVSEGLHHQRLKAASDQVMEFLERGGAAAIFGDQPEPWLPGLDWEFRPAKRPEAGELIVGSPEHSFHRWISLGDIWHYHGVFHPPSGAQTLLGTADGAAALYIDEASAAGTMLVTSMDLLRHAIMPPNPVASRFLDQFLSWFVEELL